MRANALRGWLLLGLVPAMFAIDLWLPTGEILPTGISEALGCSGAGNTVPVEGWTYLQPAHDYAYDSARVPVAVATDGFFTIQAEGNGLSWEDARAQLRVVVTDAVGAEVAGDVSVLDTSREGSYLFGWVAREPLPLGAQLTATLGTEPEVSGRVVGGQFPLLVEGQPTALPEPQLVLEEWARYFKGTGKLVRCELRPGTCSGQYLVPSEALEQVRVLAFGALPEVTGSVVWRLRVEVGSEQEDSARAATTRVYFGEAADGKAYVGDVFFAHVAQRYCATLVLEDLRSHDERRAELCVEPGALTTLPSVNDWGQCKSPPTAATTRAWCELNAQSALPACAEFRRPGNESCSFSPGLRAPWLALLASAVPLLVLPLRRRRRH